MSAINPSVRFAAPDFLRFLEYTPCHRGVTFLRNQLRSIVRRKLKQKEKVRRSRSFAEQLDALADEGRDG